MKIPSFEVLFEGFLPWNRVQKHNLDFQETKLQRDLRPKKTWMDFIHSTSEITKIVQENELLNIHWKPNKI